jgi:hypothetical protein
MTVTGRSHSGSQRRHSRRDRNTPSAAAQSPIAPIAFCSTSPYVWSIPPTFCAPRERTP